MLDSRTGSTPGSIAKKPEHYHDCYRLIPPGQTRHLAIDNAMLCPDCNRATDAVRLSVGLTYPRRTVANYEGGSWYLKGVYSF